MPTAFRLQVSGMTLLILKHLELSCESCNTAYGEEFPMIRHISAIIKKWPPLFRILRPIVHYLNARASVWRARIVNVRFPRMHDAATGKGWRVRRVGARAAGRKIVMLVVSDLRVDPRVEREARALASAGYIVTVICPEPSVGAGATYNLDWGRGVVIKYVHWT